MTDLRACVLSPDYRLAFTWERDGSIWLVDRQTGGAVLLEETAHSLTEFNRFLESQWIQPLKTRAERVAALEQKRLEKWAAVEVDEGVTEMF